MGEESKELYPGHAEELKRHEERIAGIEAANGAPLPGPLLAAYTRVPQTIAGLTVRPVVHYDFALLAKLDSPLLRHLRGGTAEETPFTDEEAYEIVYQFTRPIKEVAAQVLTDRAGFRLRATEAIGMTLGTVEVNLLVKAVEREFIRSFATVIKYEPRPENGEVFTPPPATTTASAGGSGTSAA